MALDLRNLMFANTLQFMYSLLHTVIGWEDLHFDSKKPWNFVKLENHRPKTNDKVLIFAVCMW